MHHCYYIIHEFVVYIEIKNIRFIIILHWTVKIKYYASLLIHYSWVCHIRWNSEYNIRNNTALNSQNKVLCITAITLFMSVIYVKIGNIKFVILLHWTVKKSIFFHCYFIFLLVLHDICIIQYIKLAVSIK